MLACAVASSFRLHFTNFCHHLSERETCWVTCFSTQRKLVYALRFADLTSIGKMSDYID